MSGRFSIRQGLCWTAVFAVNASLWRAFILDDMLIGAILPLPLLQLAAWKVRRSQSKSRRFWLGFLIGGGASLLGLFGCEVFENSAISKLVMVYVSAVDALAYRHLPDRAYESIESFYSLFLAIGYSIPQLVFAIVAGVSLWALRRSNSTIETRVDDDATVGSLRLTDG
jgi:hypothetical protein